MNKKHVCSILAWSILGVWASSAIPPGMSGNLLVKLPDQVDLPKNGSLRPIPSGEKSLSPRGWIVQVPEKAPNPWDVQWSPSLGDDLEPGTVVVVLAWIRPLDGEGNLRAKVQWGESPYKSVVEGGWKPKGEGAFFRVTGVVAERVRKPQLSLHLGAVVQRLVVSGLTVVTFPPGTPVAKIDESTAEEIIKAAEAQSGKLPTVPGLSLESPLEKYIRGLGPDFDKAILMADGRAFGEWRKSSGETKIESVAVSGLPFDKAWHFTVVQKPRNYWDQQILFYNTNAIPKGATVNLHFHARARGQGPANLNPIAQLSRDPWTSALGFSSLQDATLTPDWKDYHYIIPLATRGYASGELQIGINVGIQEQEFEIGGFALLVYPPSVAASSLPKTFFPLVYPGQEAGAPWRAEAAARIEKFRKGDLAIHVLGSDGKPMAGAQVSIHQKTSDFGWGAAVTAKWLSDPSPDGETYRKIFLEYFNKAVLENDLKWPNWADPSSRSKTSNAVTWLEDHGIAIRGHCLVWPSFGYLPQPVRSLSNQPEALARVLDDRVSGGIGAFAGRMVDWDVVNEPYGNFDLMKIYGTNIMEHWYDLARKADPKTLLWLNDYNQIEKGGGDTGHNDYLETLLSGWKKKGVPVDGLGFQAHFNNRLTDLAKVYAILDRYARLGLKIQVTEFDITTEDEKGQADYTRDLMTVVFSHPAATGFVNWGFWEKAHWIPSGAYFRGDWSPKPNALVWKELTTKTWRTQAEVKTDGQGVAKCRAFHGAYEVTVRAGGKSVTKTLTVSGPETRGEMRL